MGSPLAKSAIDVAVHDALARRHGVPLHELLGRRRRTEFDLTWMVTSTAPHDADRLAREGLDAGYECFECKVGMHGEAGDLELITRTHETIGLRTLQVDANRGYRLDAAIRQARRFEEIGVTLFEQPLDGLNLSGYRRLVAATATPIGIDETLRSLGDLLEYARHDAIGGA